MKVCFLRPIALLAASLWLIGPEVVAERLVLRDGTVMEISGPWRVKGRQVLFTLPTGTLSSLRIDDVDVEASESLALDGPDEDLTGEAEQPDGAMARREPVMVITNDDVPRARAAESAAAADELPPIESEVGSEPGEAGPADAEGDVVFAADGLEVSGWRSIDSPRGGVEITGVLVNRGESLVAEASVRMKATTTDGTEASYRAIISNATLGPGQQSPFRILLPDVFAVDESVVFEVEGRAIRPRVTGFGSAPDAEDETLRNPERDQR